MLEVTCGPETLTDLFDAVRNGKLSTVVSLISCRLGAQTFRNVASTLVHQAVNNGHCEVLSFLLECNAHVDSRVADGTTPLMVCAQKGDVETLKLLLSHSADVNAVDNIGRSSLYFAAYAGHGECVDMILLQLCLDPTVDTVTRGCKVRPPSCGSKTVITWLQCNSEGGRDRVDTWSSCGCSGTYRMCGFVDRSRDGCELCWWTE